MTGTTGAHLTAIPTPIAADERKSEWLDAVLVWPERHPVLWVLISAFLGVLMQEVAIAATMQALAVLAAVAGIALVGRHIPLAMVALVYSGQCDVLWRATGAKTPWEASKYLLILLSAAVVIRLIRRPGRLATPLSFIACLLPAALATFAQIPFSAARDGVAFTLLGPIALAACAVLCRQIVVDRAEMRCLLWWALSPCVSIGAITAWGTIHAGPIKFGDESMFVTAGGFGPNQVSAMLGLGALISVALLLCGSSGRQALVAAFAGLALVIQSFLTLSRGGIYAFALAAIAMFAASLLLSGNRSRSFMILVGGALLALFAFTWAQGFSGGAVENRFAQDDSGRGRIVATEIALFREFPVSGVGAGQAPSKRVLVDPTETYHASHNEFSRLLAEHGLFGVAAIGLLTLMAVQAFTRGISTTNRAITLGFIVWSAASMSHSATRLAATGLLFGLASLRIEDEPGPEIPATGGPG